MARTHGKGSRIYLDEFDISGDASSMDQAGTVDMTEVSGMGDVAKEYLPGLADSTFTLAAWWDDTATTGSEEVLTDYWKGAETGILTYCPEGVADSAIVYTNAEAGCTGLTVTGGIGGAVAANSTWQSSGALERMVVLYEGTITETTNGASIDFGSVGTLLAGAAVIHVTAWTGGGTLDVKLQESSDATGTPDTWADESGAVFTQLTAIGSEHDTWAGATEQYVRCVMTVVTASSITLMVAAKCGATLA